MDYLKVYNKLFINKEYAMNDHVQYDFVINSILKYNLDNNNIIDIGSGRGKNLLNLINNKSFIKNLKTTSVDLDNFHNVIVDNFIKCDLSKELDRNNLLNSKYDILICTDVFEHLDKSFIEDVIELCSKISKYSIIAIANHSDIWNGIELHTIQENIDWWNAILDKYFYINYSESLINDCLYIYRLTSKIYI